MKYISPSFKNESLDICNVILTSMILEGGAKLTEINKNSAKVSASVYDVLGIR